MNKTTFDALFDDFFFNTLYTKNKNNYSYPPTRCAVDSQDDKLELAFSVIGHDPKNIEVNLTTDKIHIKAKKDSDDKSISGQLIKDIDETLYLTKEFDGLTAKAQIKNGVLSILVDKKEDQKPKKLSIKF
jgi:HSP20 family molecular chaperone IbpA